MNFLLAGYRRTKVFATSTAVVHMVLTVNPTPSVTVPARPLPKRPGAVATALHTPSPHVVVTTDPTRSVMVSARPLKPRAAQPVARNMPAQTLIRTPSQPPTRVKPGLRQAAGRVLAQHTALPRSAAGVAPPESITTDAAHRPTLAPRASICRTPIPPVTTPASAELVRPDVVRSAPRPATIAPRTTAIATRAADPLARPRPPRLIKSGTRRSAAPVVATRDANPPEPIGPARGLAPITVLGGRSKRASGRLTCSHTPVLNGTLGIPRPIAGKASIRPRASGGVFADATGLIRIPPLPRPMSVTGGKAMRRAGSSSAAKTRLVLQPIPPPAKVCRPGYRVPPARPLVPRYAPLLLPLPAPRMVRPTKRAAWPAARCIVVATAKAAATTFTVPRPVARTVRQLLRAKPAAQIWADGSPAGPTPTPRPRLIMPVRRPAVPGRSTELHARPSLVRPLPSPDIVLPGLPAKRHGRILLARTRSASPVLTGPVPHVLLVSPVRRARLAGRLPTIASNGLPPTPPALAGDVMAAVIAALGASSDVLAAFGSIEKFGADTVNFTASLPYGVYSETNESPQRILGGTAIGHGSFELGVFDTGKLGARQKMDLVRRVIDAMPDQLLANSFDRLFYIRHQDHSGKDLKQTAPGSDVTEFGRSLVFEYKVTRNDG